MPTKPRLIIAASVILVAVLLIVGATAKAQTSQPYTQVIMNLLHGQQYFGVPHIYQGDFVHVSGETIVYSCGFSICYPWETIYYYSSSPTNQWPVYYGPNNASQYWSQGGISSDQPVLDMTPLQGTTAGAMFWSETYIGGPVKITIIGTFSSGSSPVADGYEIYLFLKPTMWGVGPAYNWSIPYEAIFSSNYPSPVHGDVILPQSSTPYIVVQWDPIWSNGQWNVWIVNNTKGNNPSVTPSPSPNGVGSAGWNGIGTGAFQPRPGDRINITVTYNPSTNTLSGVATDLNTGQSVSFTLNLTGYYTPPSSGNYVFGVGASTGSHYADWALLYAAMTYIPPPPSGSMVSVGLHMSYGGLIMLINKPGLPMGSLILNGPVSNSLTLPINTTITLIIWPYNGYTLAGLNVNNNTMNYIETPWGSYIATITITKQTTITITYKQKESSTPPHQTSPISKTRGA